MLRKFLVSGLIFSSVLTLSSCYRVAVPQGNVLNTQEVSKVKMGMTAPQVIAKIGNPVLYNTYLNNQLAYVYTTKHGLSKVKKQRLIIYFYKGRVSNIIFDNKTPKATLPPLK